MNTLGEMHAAGQQQILNYARYYRFPEEEIEDRIWHNLDKILQASSFEQGYELQKKAIDKFFINALASWAKGRIKGPASNEALEKEAKRAENLATLLREKVSDEAADKQLAKASNIRKRIKRTKE